MNCYSKLVPMHGNSSSSNDILFTLAGMISKRGGGRIEAAVKSKSDGGTSHRYWDVVVLLLLVVFVDIVTCSFS